MIVVDEKKLINTLYVCMNIHSRGYFENAPEPATRYIKRYLQDYLNVNGENFDKIIDEVVKSEPPDFWLLKS